MADLKEYFPMIRERKEVMEEIGRKDSLRVMFASWTEEQQEEFLDWCTGVRGIRMLYDGFFKEIMNPESTPERLDELLSLLLGFPVRIRMVLPNDSTRLADECSLLVTDLVVELKDGSLANVEVQKIGYMFPGQRSACYSSDMLLRQYKRVRSKRRKKFSYRDVKPVYTIVLFETSTKEFHEFPHVYVHRFGQRSDTGLKAELLQKYIFIPIDIFKKTQQNKDVTGKLDAWLLFLSTDEPEEIIKLIKAYPEFKPMYQQAYEICRNMEVVMGFFSEELREMDRNTVQLMIDEMQEELDRKRGELEKTSEELARNKGELAQSKEELAQSKEELAQSKEELVQSKEELAQSKEELIQSKEELKQALLRIAQLEKEQRQRV